MEQVKNRNLISSKRRGLIGGDSPRYGVRKYISKQRSAGKSEEDARLITILKILISAGPNENST